MKRLILFALVLVSLILIACPSNNMNTEAMGYMEENIALLGFNVYERDIFTGEPVKACTIYPLERFWVIGSSDQPDVGPLGEDYVLLIMGKVNKEKHCTGYTNFGGTPRMWITLKQ